MFRHVGQIRSLEVPYLPPSMISLCSTMGSHLATIYNSNYNKGFFVLTSIWLNAQSGSLSPVA